MFLEICTWLLIIHILNGCGGTSGGKNFKLVHPECQNCETPKPKVIAGIVDWSLYSGLQDGSVSHDSISHNEIEFKIPLVIETFMRQTLLNLLKQTKEDTIFMTNKYKSYGGVRDTTYFIAIHTAVDCPRMRMIMEYHGHTERYSWLSRFTKFHFEILLKSLKELPEQAVMPACATYAHSCMVWEYSNCEQRAFGSVVWK